MAVERIRQRFTSAQHYEIAPLAFPDHSILVDDLIG
jgi:hypothetical protein